MIDAQTVRIIGEIIYDINYEDSDWLSSFMIDLPHNLSQRELMDLTIMAFRALNERHRFMTSSVIEKILSHQKNSF